jgi:hypothetical protein
MIERTLRKTFMIVLLALATTACCDDTLYDPEGYDGRPCPDNWYECEDPNGLPTCCDNSECEDWNF